MRDGIDEWFKSVKTQTRRQYEYKFKLWCAFLERRDLTLERATTSDVWDFIDDYRHPAGNKSRKNPDDKSIADASVRLTITVLHGMYSHIKRYAPEVMDPFAPVLSRFRASRSGLKQSAKAIPADKVEELRNAPEAGTPDGLRDRALIDCLVMCGMRISEALGLTVGDVSEEDGVMVLTCRHTKTLEVLEKVPPDDAARRIREYLERVMHF